MQSVGEGLDGADSWNYSNGWELVGIQTSLVPLLMK